MYGFDDPFRIEVTVRLRVESPGKSEDLKSSKRNLLTFHFTSDRALRMLKSFCSSLCGDLRCKVGVFTEELGNGAVQLVMQTARLGAVEPSSRANILASHSGKSAPGYNQLGSQISRL
jgi:hypothetical protein